MIDGSPDAFAFAVPDGRGVRRAGEVTLGRGALEELGVEIGDDVTLTADGRPFSARVVGRHIEPDDGGLGVVALAGTVPAASLRSPSWVLRVADGVDPARTQAEIERRAGPQLIVDRPGESLEREVGEMRPIVYGVTALLLAIAGVNLLTTLLLGVRERRRDVAVLGAVGASRRQVTGTVVERRPAPRRAVGARRTAARRLAVHDHRGDHRSRGRARRRHPPVVVERQPRGPGGAGRRRRCCRRWPRARRRAWRSPQRCGQSKFTELIDKVRYAAGRMPATDLHQHLWPDALVRLLERRSAAPRLRRDDRGWTLELAGEPPSPFDLSAHDPGLRAERARADGLERVIVAPSTPLGIEALPAREAQPLLDAFHAGVLELGAPFGLWASTSRADELDALLDAGAVGLCLPADALGGPEALRRVAALLERLAARDAPLLVHPGSATDPHAPSWWPAMTSYVAAMQTAWLAWAEWGRAAHPELKVVWAMLAGCAPLHVERLASRGGPAGAVHDDRSWYDVSSYGPKAVDAMLRVVGVDRLVHGSDRPVVDPPSLAALGPAFRHAVRRVNPAQVLS